MFEIHVKWKKFKRNTILKLLKILEIDKQLKNQNDYYWACYREAYLGASATRKVDLIAYRFGEEFLTASGKTLLYGNSTSKPVGKFLRIVRKYY